MEKKERKEKDWKRNGNSTVNVNVSVRKWEGKGSRKKFIDSFNFDDFLLKQNDHKLNGWMIGWWTTDFYFTSQQMHHFNFIDLIKHKN